MSDKSSKAVNRQIGHVTAKSILGIGCDIVSVARIRQAFDKSANTQAAGPWLAIFSAGEREYFSRYAEPWGVIAGHFAAKEACAKALGTGFRAPVELLSFEIAHDQLGKPIVQLSDELKELWPGLELLLSISHEKEYAVAFATALLP